MNDSDPLDSRLLPLTPPLPLPNGMREADVIELFSSFELEGAPKEEIENYWRQDWKRFVYTFGLAADLGGDCLELGANPYFTSILLRLFSSLKLTFANYFGSGLGSHGAQTVAVRHPGTGETQRHTLEFQHFNTEDDAFPFESASFDVVLFCEVIEHLQSDPIKVLLEIKRVLKPSGHLILTTPNVSRLENVCRMLAGANIYDPFSGYGPYGRHNREYNKHELAQLLAFCGFEMETLFSADVHENNAPAFFSLERVLPLVDFRKFDLGQYLFSRSRNTAAARAGRPSWLYRSYPAGELQP
jgi:SAM-dependent methyltransferase